MNKRLIQGLCRRYLPRIFQRWLRVPKILARIKFECPYCAKVYEQGVWHDKEDNEMALEGRPLDCPCGAHIFFDFASAAQQLSECAGSFISTTIRDVVIEGQVPPLAGARYLIAQKAY